MIKITHLFPVLLIYASAYTQTECKYKNSLKFKYDKASLNTEQGGLFKNALLVRPRSFQVEANSFTGSYPNEYSGQVIVVLSQWRYGLDSGMELQAGLSVLDPKEIRSDTNYFGNLQLGLKKKLVHTERRSLSWDLAIAGSYLAQAAGSSSSTYRHGISLSVNNSLFLYRLIQFDLALGAIYFLKSNKVQPYLSSQFIFRDENSISGLLIAFCGNQYLENLFRAGIYFTNNRNLIIQLSAGYFDKVISPNISLTYLFNTHHL